MHTSIDWSAFLGRHDLIWARMPQRWLDAPFLGNGMMGTMVRQTGDRTVRWDVESDPGCQPEKRRLTNRLHQI